MGIAVQNARNCIQLPFRDPYGDLRIPSDALDPSDGFASFDEQVEPFAAHYKPNLDLAPQARLTPDGGQT